MINKLNDKFMMLVVFICKGKNYFIFDIDRYNFF